MKSPLSRRFLDLDDVFNSSSEYRDIRTLGKRLFTYTAGSTDPDDYSGKTKPKVAQVNAYIPNVEAGKENAYFGAPLPTIELGKYMAIVKCLLNSFIHCSTDRSYRIQANGEPVDERAVSQQLPFEDKPFQIISTNVYGCTVVRKPFISLVSCSSRFANVSIV